MGLRAASLPHAGDSHLRGPMDTHTIHIHTHRLSHTPHHAWVSIHTLQFSRTPHLCCCGAVRCVRVGRAHVGLQIYTWIGLGGLSFGGPRGLRGPRIRPVYNRGPPRGHADAKSKQEKCRIGETAASLPLPRPTRLPRAPWRLLSSTLTGRGVSTSPCAVGASPSSPTAVSRLRDGNAC